MTGLFTTISAYDLSRLDRNCFDNFDLAGKRRKVESTPLPHNSNPLAMQHFQDCMRLRQALPVNQLLQSEKILAVSSSKDHFGSI